MKVVLISCVSKKLPSPAKARDLYISPLFVKNFAYAKKLKADKIFILSAKYGLIEPEKKIDTYNQTLNTMKAPQIRAWAAGVMKELKKKTNVEKDEYVFLAGAAYRKYLMPHLPHTRVPMQGLGIGRQLQYLKRHVG